MRKLDRLEGPAREKLAFSPLQYMFDFAAEHPQAAQVFTDDRGLSCALLLGHYLFIGGEAGDEFVGELAEGVLTDERRAEMGVAIVFYDRPEVAEGFKRRFGKAYDNQRSVYRLNNGVHGATGERVTRVTAALMGSGLENLGMIAEEVLGTGTYGPDMQRFLEQGIGYTYVEDGAVHAFCTSEYPSRAAIAIGIEVEEAYQRRGIASEMTAALTAEAVRRGLAVYWECWTRNEPSVRTALKGGFEHIADYPVVFLDFN